MSPQPQFRMPPAHSPARPELAEAPVLSLPNGVAEPSPRVASRRPQSAPDLPQEFFGKNSYVREAPHAHPATKYAGPTPPRLPPTMTLPFTKMHGAGNDFVLLDGRADLPSDLGDVARAIGDRHMGVGFDQLLVVRDGQSHPYHMEIWNSDGSLAEMCGNGIRCFAKWLYDQGELSTGPVTVQTAGGPRPIQVGGYVNGSFQAAVGMGVPDFDPANIPMHTNGPGSRTTLNPNGMQLTVTGVSMGNPHAVSFQDSVDEFPLEHIGPLVEHDPAFPERVNFEIVQVLAPGHLSVRVWERGAGITLACGTGASAAVAAAVLEGRIDPGTVDLDMPGGRLRVDWNGPGHELILRGPAATVFEGAWPTTNAAEAR